MASHKVRRIGKELADIAADTQSNIRAEFVGDSITTLKGSFHGPVGTPFEGGVYDINIQISNEYPFKPPVMKFVYNKDMIDRFCSMGFDVDRVVAAFRFVGIDRMNGEDYELEEAYMGDVTVRLLGEP